jgi:hypothetical protein
MKKQMFGILAFVLGLAAALPAGAADEGVYLPEGAFVAIDAFRREREFGGAAQDDAEIVVTGLLRGNSAPGTYNFSVRRATTCERMLSLSMERPGRYVVSVVRTRYDTYPVCELSRQP